MSWLSNKFSKFSQEGKGKGTKQILCPHCGSIQDISAKAELTFCNECKKIINARKAKTVEKIVIPANIEIVLLPKPISAALREISSLFFI